MEWVSILMSWKLIVPTVCFDLCKYKKSDIDPTLYRLHYSELL